MYSRDVSVLRNDRKLVELRSSVSAGFDARGAPKAWMLTYMEDDQATKSSSDEAIVCRKNERHGRV